MAWETDDTIPRGALGEGEPRSESSKGSWRLGSAGDSCHGSIEIWWMFVFFAKI
jgi:hypothetical protein